MLPGKWTKNGTFGEGGMLDQPCACLTHDRKKKFSYGEGLPFSALTGMPLWQLREAKSLKYASFEPRFLFCLVAFET